MSTILQINVDANNGSNGSIAKAIGDIALSHGWKSYIAYGRSVSPGNSIQFQIGNNIDVKLHAIETRLFDNHGLASRIVTHGFIKKVREIKPDIIHLHNIHGYFINYKILFKYLQEAQIPVIWTLHDCWSFTGHCGHFVTASCDKWKEHCNNCPLRVDYPKSIFIDRSKENFELKKKLFTSVNNFTIVPVSYWLGDLVKQSFLKEQSIHVIQNGIDLKVFKPTIVTRSTLGLDSRKKIILGIANVWTNAKGLQEFIELSKNDNYQIVMIGVDDKMKKLIPDNIITISRTENQKQLVQYYSVADVLVNPTYADTFPTINLEALACGTPVVTYNTGGSPEAVDENTGIVVEQGNFEDLCSAIRLIISEDTLTQAKRRENCRARAVELFDKNDRFKEYFELYNQVLSK